jgi:flagellar basal-body rod protein FlgF
MIYGLYHSAAGMMTQEYRENVIANNLANADTVGFKQEVATFAERNTASEAGERQGPSAPDLQSLSGGLWLGRTQTDFSQAGLTQTDNSTDVALDGPGFFAVEANGHTLYTRDGRLMKDADGFLRSAADGAPVLNAVGTPIIMNPRGGQPTFDEDGRIWQDGGLVGQLQIVDFADERVLRHAGNGRFDAGGAETIPSLARVQPGYVERSGVEPVRELVNMIETSRAYQLNAQMLSLQDQSAGRLISVLAA